MRTTFLLLALLLNAAPAKAQAAPNGTKVLAFLEKHFRANEEHRGLDSPCTLTLNSDWKNSSFVIRVPLKNGKVISDQFDFSTSDFVESEKNPDVRDVHEETMISLTKDDVSLRFTMSRVSIHRKNSSGDFAETVRCTYIWVR